MMLDVGSSWLAFSLFPTMPALLSVLSLVFLISGLDAGVPLGVDGCLPWSLFEIGWSFGFVLRNFVLSVEIEDCQLRTHLVVLVKLGSSNR